MSTRTPSESSARYPVSRCTAIVMATASAAHAYDRPRTTARYPSPHAMGSSHIPHTCVHVP